MYIIKKEIDDYFFQNWTKTPIQFEGAKFTQPKDGRWIAVRYIPYSRGYHGICVETKATVRIVIFETSVTECYKLGDEVIGFFELQDINKVSVSHGYTDGFPADDLDGIFRTSTLFDVSSFASKYVPPTAIGAFDSSFSSAFDI